MSNSEVEEEESLSLSDLPIAGEGEDGKQAESETEEVGEFDFGSLVASLDELEAEMCAADEVFFRGQILPFRHSASSAGNRGTSTASTSRSSSTRSSSINSSASAGKLPQLKVRNQFHSFPSPKPYARAANAPRSSTANSSSKRSAVWEIFRLGLVRTPEIELEDLKVRYGKNQIRAKSGKEQRKRRKRGTLKLMSSCKSSVGAVEPEKGERSVKKVVVGEEEGQRKRDGTRHHRTFEWLKDLSQSHSHSLALN